MMRCFLFGMLAASVAASTASAVTITDNFSYANSAAFEAVYTKSNTAGGDWTAAFDGSKLTVTGSTPATGAFDSFYARRPVGPITGNFSATLDVTWSSANEPGERARFALHLLKGDGTGVHSTSLPQFAPWTFANDSAAAGLWNDYGINAATVLIGGVDDPAVSPAQFPWRPAPGVGSGGAATLSIKRVGGILKASYDDGTVTRTLTTPNADAFTHIGLWYSHFTGFPGQFDGSATYTADNLTVFIPPTPVPGDADRDGGVDIDDYLLIQAHAFEEAPFGPTPLGDLNDDEFVDFDDFQLWKTSFPGGVAAAEAAIAALVPEPASAVMGGIALASLLWVNRRRVKN